MRKIAKIVFEYYRFHRRFLFGNKNLKRNLREVPCNEKVDKK